MILDDKSKILIGFDKTSFIVPGSIKKCEGDGMFQARYSPEVSKLNLSSKWIKVYVGIPSKNVCGINFFRNYKGIKLLPFCHKHGHYCVLVHTSLENALDFYGKSEINKQHTYSYALEAYVPAQVIDLKSAPEFYQQCGSSVIAITHWRALEKTNVVFIKKY